MNLHSSPRTFGDNLTFFPPRDRLLYQIAAKDGNHVELNGMPGGKRTWKLFTRGNYQTRGNYLLVETVQFQLSFRSGAGNVATSAGPTTTN